MIRQFVQNNLVRRIALLAGATMTWLAAATPCRAIQLVLPPVGTPINYDFTTAQPLFTLAVDAPPEAFLNERVRFAGGRLLRAEGTFLVVTLALRGGGVGQAIQQDWILFDEIMSLDSADDSFFALEKNSSTTSNPAGDMYGYSWDFRLPPGALLRGLSWDITPQLMSGKQLPATLKLEMYAWSDGPIVVIPEPAAGSLALLSLAFVGWWRRARGVRANDDVRRACDSRTHAAARTTARE